MKKHSLLGAILVSCLVLAAFLVIGYLVETNKQNAMIKTAEPIIPIKMFVKNFGNFVPQAFYFQHVDGHGYVGKLMPRQTKKLVFAVPQYGIFRFEDD